MKQFSFSILCFLMIIISACSEKISKEQKDFMLGRWQAVDWSVIGTNKKYDTHFVVFTFSENNSYKATLGETSEAGKWYIDGNGNLHTQAENKAEIATKIMKLTKDSLQLLMNRSGTEEEIIFVKSDDKN